MPATSGAKPLILVVIDGLTPSMLEDTLERGAAPALGLLAEHGRYRRAVSTFPSLTPVCLSSLATGAHPDVHEIPHLVWYHRGERRLVEYGSSFGAVRAAGTRQSLVDTVYGLNASHLGRGAVTVYEALEDAGLTAAAVNITCYRGRHPHSPTVPFLTRPALGPRRFFFYNLFESDVTGAPLSVRNRPRGTLQKMSPSLKKRSETENERSTSRSRLRSESGRRRSASPSRKTAQNESQSHMPLIVRPPNAPAPPRAIVQATCGPVHASRTRPEPSSTLPSTICPASPDHTFTTHSSDAARYSASVCGFGG